MWNKCIQAAPGLGLVASLAEFVNRAPRLLIGVAAERRLKNDLAAVSWRLKTHHFVRRNSWVVSVLLVWYYSVEFRKPGKVVYSGPKQLCTSNGASNFISRVIRPTLPAEVMPIRLYSSYTDSTVMRLVRGSIFRGS